MVWTWIAVGTVLTVIGADWAYRRFASSRICELVDNVPPFGLISPTPAENAETICIPTTDDLHLAAALHFPKRDPKGVILFCPELHGSHWTVTNYAPALIDAGYAVLGFDFRNQGDSDYQPAYEPIHWSTEGELADINAVLNYIAGDDTLRHLPLGAFGICRGGSAALVAACRTEQIQSIVTDGAYDSLSLVQNFIDKFSRYVAPDWFFNCLPRWHVDWVLRMALRKSERRRGGHRQCIYLRLADEASGFTQPALLISGKRDSYVTPNVTAKLATQLQREGNVWVVPKAKHNKARSVAPEEYDARLVAHFDQTLHMNSIDVPISGQGETATST